MENKSDQGKQSCPCYSGNSYKDCCQKYHQGDLPENALVLMRSRYCAYALGLADYIIETTHPSHPFCIPDREQWLAKIQLFSQQTSFDGLDILDTDLSDSVSFVTFFAHLRGCLQINSQGSAERGTIRSKQSILNEEEMVKAMPGEEDRLGQAEAGRIPEVICRHPLSAGGVDQSFTEKSRFLKVDGVWKYLDGEIIDRSKNF